MSRRLSLGRVRTVLALVVGVALLAGTVTAVGHDPVGLGPGTVSQPAEATTLVSVQGFHFKGTADRKKPARLVAADATARTAWRYESRPRARWFYDVDPLADGNVFVTATVPGDTIVFEYDPANDTRVWEQRFDATDTHDADLINGDQVLLANMRAYDPEAGVSNDRVFIWDRTKDEIVWEWRVRNHYPDDTAGGFGEDWTHINDVDEVRDGTYLLSLRDFDQAIVVDRATKNVTMRLGSDDAHDVMYEQHNPDLFVDEAGRPTILVADSENDRVVEYSYVGPDGDEVLSTPVETNEGEWERTWTVEGFKWPRDADRLSNGNTLVTDSQHHRVVEIAPDGEVVWEVYAPWLPYDAERLGTGAGSATGGPSIRDLDAAGSYAVHGGAGEGPVGNDTPADVVVGATRGWPFADAIRWGATRYAHVEPWVRPVWLSPWSFAFLALAALVAVPWGVGEVYRRRQRVRRRVGRAWSQARDCFRTAD